MQYLLRGFKIRSLVGALILLNVLAAHAADTDLKVMITPEIASKNPVMLWACSKG